MNLETTIIERQTRAINRLESQQQLLDSEAEKIVGKALAEADQTYQMDLLRRIGMTYKLGELRSIHQLRAKGLDPARMLTAEQVQRLCCEYGLRFLDARHYSGPLDPGIGAKVMEFETLTGLRDWSYHIMAPKSMFKLEARPQPVDPLLFVRHHSDYYLLHKWGGDLSWWRKVIRWPWYLIQNEDILAWMGIASVIVFVLSVIACLASFADPHGPTIRFWASNMAMGSGILAYLSARAFNTMTSWNRSW